eukprot:2764137-Pyramimonas_sp.AAC.1
MYSWGRSRHRSTPEGRANENARTGGCQLHVHADLGQGDLGPRVGCADSALGLCGRPDQDMRGRAVGNPTARGANQRAAKHQRETAASAKDVKEAAEEEKEE